MKLQVTLALICVLFPKALTLKCYQCKSGLSETCTDNQTDCPDQCGSTTVLVNQGQQRQWINTNGCTVAAECVSGSLNLGLLKMTINSQCCRAALCNSQNVPAAIQGPPNGKKCYFCTAKNCTGTVSCEGDEDRCITATATGDDALVTMKGCASIDLCTGPASTMQAAGITGDVNCLSSLCGANMAWSGHPCHSTPSPLAGLCQRCLPTTASVGIEPSGAPAAGMIILTLVVTTVHTTP
ncbi:urokinase plasminogen activator surface receptor-like, partial [Colossoma macropomum]|uniref:urokinase plasminogen activator surface receptor-like n=1 Tax=Colossoma macropomum TaxID=42526 RepID=UPI0018651BEA